MRERGSVLTRLGKGASRLVAPLATFGAGVMLLGTPAQGQGPAVDPGVAVEQILLFRHGEKPVPEAFGQLDCKGLNRALSLPGALSRYGLPTALFAPDPAVPFYPDVSNAATPASGHFSYVRPLTTIEPLAIIAPTWAGRPSLPVDTSYPYYKADDLATALLRPEMARANVFIAWEHVNLTTIAKDVMARFTTTTGKVPDAWDDDDFDSIYVIRIERKPDGSASARFERTCEGLGDGGRACPLPAGRRALSSACPGPASATGAGGAVVEPRRRPADRTP